MDANSNYKNEKVLKVLIAVGIIAIIVSVYIQYLKPYIIELSFRKNDQTRIQDLSSINAALDKLREISPDFFLGEPNKVYISLLSSKLNCEDLDLPSLPENWEYRCQSESNYQKIDGQGWIPVDFTKLSDNSFSNLLPIDSVNSANDLFYYAYIAKEGGWALNSLLRSNKFIKQLAINDEGNDPIRFEIGSNLKLWAQASGLAGYWKFDDGGETTTADSSGNNDAGILMNEPVQIDGKSGKALSFDGMNDYVDAGNAANLDLTNDITISFWFNPAMPSMLFAENAGLIEKWAGNTGYMVTTKKAGGLYFYDGPDALESTRRSFNAGTWYNIIAVIDRSETGKKTLYIDGAKDNSKAVSVPTTNTKHLEIGRYAGSPTYFNGAIDEIRVYNRALNMKEIQVIYNAMK